MNEVNDGKEKPIQLEFFKDSALDLWAHLNDGYSSTLELFDRLPIYLGRRSADEIRKTRINHRIPHTRKKIELEFAIWPASIERKTKDPTRSKAQYVQPGMRELHLESVIRALAVKKYKDGLTQWAKPQDADANLTVVVSLYEIHQELRRLKHKYRYDEIAEGLDILRRTNIEINSKVDDGKPYHFPELPVLYSADANWDKPGTWYRIMFHPMVAAAIYSEHYLRHNYMLEHTAKLGALAIWLYRRMAYEFRQASFDTHYHLALQTIMKEGPVASRKVYAERRNVETAWRELCKAGILQIPDPFLLRLAELPDNDGDEPFVSIVHLGVSRGGRPPIADVVYHVWTSQAFNDFMVESLENRKTGREVRGFR